MYQVLCARDEHWLTRRPRPPGTHRTVRKTRMEAVNISNMLQHSDKLRAEKHFSGGTVKPGNASHKRYLMESRKMIVSRLSGRTSPSKKNIMDKEGPWHVQKLICILLVCLEHNDCLVFKNSKLQEILEKYIGISNRNY